MASVDSNSSPRRLSAPWSDSILVALLLLATLVCYLNILGNSFVYDDDQQILQNPYVKSWHFLPQIFTTTVWSFVGQAGATNYYRPLMTFSFLLLWQLFGPIPFGFHLFSIIMHAAVVMLVFYVGRRLFADWRIGFFSALLFAIHPVHTETVDWIAALPDIEATFFLLLALYLLAAPAQLTWRRNAVVAAAFVLALLCKEPAFMFAPLAIIYVHAISEDRGQTKILQKIYRYLPLCLLGVAYLFLRILLFGKLAPVLQRPKLTWPEAIYSSFALIVDYTKMLLWPARLSAFHVFHASTSLTQLPVLAGIAIVLCCLIGLWFLCQKSPSAAFSILILGFTLGPVLNARWMAANVFTERYLYLPSVGFCWFIIWLGVQAWDYHVPPATLPRARRIVLALVATGVVVVSVPATITRNRDWRSDLALYTRTLETNPDAHIIRGNLAGVYFDAGDLPRARQEWERTLQGKPDSVNSMNALGILFTKTHQYPEAVARLNQAIALRPLWGDPHFNLGVVLEKMGDHAGALTELRLAVQLAPLNPTAHYFYAEQLVASGDDATAEAQYTETLRLDSSPVAMQGLAALYIRNRRWAQAEPLLRKIIVQSPLDGEAHLALGKILADTGRLSEARHEFQSVLETDPHNQEALAYLKNLH